MLFKIRSTKEKDLSHIISNMRESDTREIWASNHLTPKEAVMMSYNISDHCYTLLAEGVPIAIAGVATANDLKGGVVWMLGTPEVEKHTVGVVKSTRFLVRKHRKDYEYLFNWIHNDNKTTQRWLHRLGFTIHTPEVWGVDGELFRKIYMDGG